MENINENNPKPKIKIGVEEYNKSREDYLHGQERYGEYLEQVKLEKPSYLENIFNSYEDDYQNRIKIQTDRGSKLFEDNVTIDKVPTIDTGLDKDAYKNFYTDLENVLADVNKIRRENNEPEMDMPRIAIFQGVSGAEFIGEGPNGMLNFGSGTLSLEHNERLAVLAHELGHASQYNSEGISDAVVYHASEHINKLSPELYNSLHEIASDKTIDIAFSTDAFVDYMHNEKEISALVKTLKNNGIDNLKEIEDLRNDDEKYHKIREEINNTLKINSTDALDKENMQAEYAKIKPEIDAAMQARKNQKIAEDQKAEYFANDVLVKLQQETGKPYADAFIARKEQQESQGKYNYEYDEIPKNPEVAPLLTPSGRQPPGYEIQRIENGLGVEHKQPEYKQPEPISSIPSNTPTLIAEPDNLEKGSAQASIIHLVEGDTLEKIANKLGIEDKEAFYADVMKANEHNHAVGKDKHHIRAGEDLTISEEIVKKHHIDDAHMAKAHAAVAHIKGHLDKTFGGTNVSAAHVDDHAPVMAQAGGAKTASKGENALA